MLLFKYGEIVAEIDGQEYQNKITQDITNKQLNVKIANEKDVFSISISSEKNIKLKSFKAVFAREFKQEDKIFLNGYQSWTDSIEHSVSGKMRGVNQIPKLIRDKYAFTQYGDYNFVKYSKTPGQLHGFSYGYIRNENRYDFIGSLNENDGFTIIKTDVKSNEIIIEKDCTNYNFIGEFSGIKIYNRTGAEAEVFDDYFNHLGVKLREGAKEVWGYTSWYKHYQNINEKLITEDLDAIFAQDYPASVFQIDDGYQTAIGDWLSVDKEKFPNGMETIASEIHKKNLKAGLWLAPFVCEENSRIFRNHNNWIVRDKEGSLVKGGSNWSGFYALDIYNLEVRDYLKKVFETVTKEWGYDLLKLDFLYAACIEPTENKTRGMIMADGMDFIRECVGDKMILGCGVPLASAFGKVEYCRIGCDVSLDWNDKAYMRLMHRERISTKNTILNSVFRRQLNGRAFLNDPDVFLLRDDNMKMKETQRIALAEINSICGGLLFTSDNLLNYGDFQKKILSRMKKLKNAKITSAKIEGKNLIIEIKSGDKDFIRKYKL